MLCVYMINKWIENRFYFVNVGVFASHKQISIVLSYISGSLWQLEMDFWKEKEKEKNVYWIDDVRAGGLRAGAWTG